MEINTAIKGISFKGLESYDVSSLVFYESENDRIKGCSKSSFLRDFAQCFISNKFSYARKKDSSKILFFTHITHRKDIINSISSLAVSSDGDFLRKITGHAVFPIFRGLTMVSLLLSWKKTLSVTGLTKGQKQALLSRMIVFKQFDLFLDTINLQQYRLVVVSFDAHSLDRFLVHRCKKDQIITATLQHGIVNAPIDINTWEYTGIELCSSISDYFLAWNQFTYDEAKKCNVDLNRIKIAGILKCIELPVLSYKRGINNNIFGILLDNARGDLNNRKMIPIANELAQVINFKYVIRFHPSYKGNEYDDLIDFNFYQGQDKHETLAEYAQSIEFTIQANSTTLIELIYMGYPVYKYTSNDKFDKCKDLTYNTFSNLEELLCFIQNNIDESSKMFELLCSVKDIRETYCSFFKTLIN